MRHFDFRRRLAFGAPEGDIIGQAAIKILEDLQKVQGKSYPIISFNLSEEYKKGILIAFFTLSKDEKRKGLHCAAHKFYLKEPVSLITPFVVGCHSKAIEKENVFKKSVISIANNYCCWAIMGFPINNQFENSFFPPWGKTPTGQQLDAETVRQKEFRQWKQAVEEYLKTNTLL